MATLNGNRLELTQEQRQIIADEINNDPRYTDVTTGGACKLLNDKPLVDNIQLQGEISAPHFTPGEILRRTGIGLAEIGAIQADVEGKAVWEIFISLPEIDLNSSLASECLDKLQEKGLVEEKKITAIKALGKTPDPNWQAKIYGQSRVEELLGAGFGVEGADIRAAQAL